MRPTTIGTFAIAAAFTAVLTGCPKDNAATPMTQAEAHDAIDESTVSSQAAALTTSSVEVSTNFTIGKAVADSAAELKTFIETQLPCAGITLADATLTVSYGAKPGLCTYRGQTFSGQHIIKITKNDADGENDIIVDHQWNDLSNGIVKVSGTAHVTWSFDETTTRHVVHDLTWTRLSDGRTGEGTGDRTQKALAGGITEGIQVDGSRTWTGAAGKWDLTIEGVQMRWQDPVPQSGTYHLATPKGRSLELSFSRVDDDTIAVTLKNDTRSFTFDVNSAGGVADK